jgi:hypothetical protein
METESTCIACNWFPQLWVYYAAAALASLLATGLWLLLWLSNPIGFETDSGMPYWPGLSPIPADGYVYNYESSLGSGSVSTPPRYRMRVDPQTGLPILGSAEPTGPPPGGVADVAGIQS